MARKSWIVYSRRAGKKTATYYAGFIQPGGKYRRVALVDEFGAAITRKAKAEEIAREQWERGAGGTANTPFSLYLWGFWDEGNAYLRYKASMRAPLAAKYIQNCRSAIHNYIKPWLEAHYPELRLHEVKASHLQEILLHLQTKALGPARINGVMKAVRIALSEAERLEMIPSNPARRIRELPNPTPRRKILEMDEALAFFALPWGEKWGMRCYFANMLAALAGLRLGEIRGLQVDDIRAGYLHVCHNFQDAERDGQKEKGPKHSTEINVRWRDVPITPKLEAALRELAAANTGVEKYVFWGQRWDTPLSTTMIQMSFREALASIGIDEAQRRDRHLNFHAWRHWFNTNMREILPDYQLRMLTGHTSVEMTDRYTEITDEQREAVGRVAARLLPGG